MAARRAATPSYPVLTEADVDDLRRRIAAGDKPRIVIRSASAAVPAGTRGTVVRLGDPAQDEYVVVRLGRDEVPFGPSELSLPGAKPVAPEVRPAARARRRPASRPAAKAAPVAEQPPTAAPPAPPARRRAHKAAQRTGRKAAAPMTVTLRFSGDAWTAEATRGARRLARPSPLRPGAVSALAAHVDDEHLRTALVETVEACRALVEERAAALRAELDVAEASLRDYDAKPRKR